MHTVYLYIILSSSIYLSKYLCIYIQYTPVFLAHGSFCYVASQYIIKLFSLAIAMVTTSSGVSGNFYLLNM